ncbi:unnamed protein product [Moneuplotes crassus]|uniref:MORN repeat protein n=1 Tax=Euplotes crassus TaxID=5936 RepID=A0AAD1XH98_EUPCR|nr:unnamed protein product [Moneuplotes crassus]
MGCGTSSSSKKGNKKENIRPVKANERPAATGKKSNAKAASNQNIAHQNTVEEVKREQNQKAIWNNKQNEDVKVQEKAPQAHNAENGDAIKAPETNKPVGKLPPLDHQPAKLASEAAPQAAAAKPKKAKVDLEELRLKDHDFYKNLLGKDIDNFDVLTKLYEEKGQFQYEGDMFGKVRCFKAKTKEGEEYVYHGLAHPRQNIPHGAGIRVSSFGIVDEGYFKHGHKEGKQRMLNTAGGWAVGTYKANKHHGDWTFAYPDKDGVILETGKCFKGAKVGKYTLTQPDGTVKDIEFPEAP